MPFNDGKCDGRRRDPGEFCSLDISYGSRTADSVFDTAQEVGEVARCWWLAAKIGVEVRISAGCLVFVWAHSPWVFQGSEVV